MTTYEQLKSEFHRKVKQLQKQCTHKNTQWFEHCWAPGHYSGYKVEICDRCNKKLTEKPTARERALAKKNGNKQFGISNGKL